MEFNINELIDQVWNTLLKPLLGIAGTSLPFIANAWAKKVVNSITTKNDLDSLVKTNEMKTILMNQIDQIVKSAVASNMQIAKTMKRGGKKLTDEQISELNSSAKIVIMKSLPEQLTSEDGSLLKLIGGKDRLDTIIDTSLEKHVYEYKLQDK